MKKYVVLILFLICLLNLSFGESGGVEKGKASYYAKSFEGKKTANGEIYTNKKLAGAHKTIAMGSIVRVTNLANGKSIDVRINDRGPYVNGRIIDLTEKAFSKIGDTKLGTIDVSIQVLE